MVNRLCSTLFLKTLLLFLFVLLSFVLIKPAFAQINPVPDSLNFESRVATASTTLGASASSAYPQQSAPNNLYISQSPHYASMAIYNFSHAMSCILIGRSPIAPCLEYQQYRDAQGMIHSIPILASTNTSNGLLGMSMSMVGTLIGSPPIRSTEFIANFGEQIGVKSAHAQVGGSGSGVLAPIFKLWEVSRNISYLVMILVFVVVGLMVMLRQKLNPQTVVTIQMALPGLIIGLVMITFSYFFASLISDLAFVGTNVVGYYFSLAQGNDTPVGLVNKDGNEDNVLTIFARFTGILHFWNIKEALDSVYPYLEKPNIGDSSTIGFFGVNTGIPDPLARALGEATNLDPAHALSILATMLTVQFLLPFGGLFGGIGQATVVGGAGVIGLIDAKFFIALSFSFIAMIVLIYTMLKLLFRLLNNFLTIIFLTIFAPFTFLMAAIPGRQKMMTDWAANMLCNVLAFPAVFAVFYFAAYMLGPSFNQYDPLFNIKDSVGIAGQSAFPLLGGFKLDILNTLIAYGALLATPTIPDIICKTVGKPSQAGAAIAGAIGASIGQGQKYAGQVEGGFKNFAGSVGRLTNETGYVQTGVDGRGRPIYKVSDYHSRVGQLSKIRARMGLATITTEAAHGAAGGTTGGHGESGGTGAARRRDDLRGLEDEDI